MSAIQFEASRPPEKQLVRFGIKSLLLLTFLFALFVSLVRQFDLLGTIILFFICLAASIWLLYVDELGMRRFWLQAIWGLIMPLACLFTDPFVFIELDDQLGRSKPGPTSIACYSFMGWQMAMLGASWFVTPRSSTSAAFLCGSLIPGAIFAAGAGLYLLPLTLVFALVVVGIPGATPWLTMIVYVSAAKYCWSIAKQSDNAFLRGLLIASGMTISLAVGAGTSLVMGRFGK